MKLCECGCGKPAPIAVKTRRALGYVKGQPVRFISGHGRRTPGPMVKAEDRGYPEGPCLIWQRAKTRNGYGQLADDRGVVRPAHRVLWESKFGPIPRDKDLDHLCRQHDCVNLLHLELVTRAENVRRGNVAKLTVIDVMAIRAFKPHVPSSHIAALYGVTRDHVARIRSRQLWRDVA